MTCLDRAIEHAFAALQRTGDPAALDPAARTLVVVVSAQGVIDNGGLGAFFGGDFPSAPPYAVFVEAYRSVGATGPAAALEEALRLLDLPEPHRQRPERMRRIEALRAASGTFEQLSDRMCGDQEVWALLEAHVERNAAAFGLEDG